MHMFFSKYPVISNALPFDVGHSKFWNFVDATITNNVPIVIMKKLENLVHFCLEHYLVHVVF